LVFNEFADSEVSMVKQFHFYLSGISIFSKNRMVVI